MLMAPFIRRVAASTQYKKNQVLQMFYTLSLLLGLLIICFFYRFLLAACSSTIMVTERLLGSVTVRSVMWFATQGSAKV